MILMESNHLHSVLLTDALPNELKIEVTLIRDCLFVAGVGLEPTFTAYETVLVTTSSYPAMLFAALAGVEPAIPRLFSACDWGQVPKLNSVNRYYSSYLNPLF